ncbi:MAG: hypothetical protein AABP62_10695 [Planctomycetota bacterium]
MQATRLSRLVATFALAVTLACGPLAFGQANGKGGEGTGDAKPAAEKSVERLIYLPFRSLKAVFEKPDGSVFVPYADYLKLIEQAMGSGLRKADQPPVGGVITSATYTAKIEKDVAQISATLVVQVLDKGWVEVPVKFGEAAIGKLSSDSGKVLLRGTGNGTYSLLLPTPGEHKVQLELTARVRTAPEGKSLDMDVPPVGITTFELVVPEADQSIELKPKLIAEAVAAVAGAKETKIKASVGSTEKISARWHPRVGTKPDMELLASVTNLTLVTVEDGLVHTDTWLTYDILRGQLEKVRIAVPKGQRILDITSDAKVKEWKAVEEENRQVVTVELLSRLDGKVTIEVHTEQSAPTEAFDVAGMEAAAAYGIHALDVIRESGTVAVKQGSDLTLTVEEQKGLLRIDESEVDAKLKRPGALYYKFYSPAFRLKLLAKPVEPRLILDHASQLVFRDDQLRLRSIASFAIDRAGVFELKFKLPENVTVENVVCDKMKQFDVSPDKTMLTISLREKTQGSLVVTVFATRSLDPTAEKTDQVLPLLEPVGVEVENGKVQVYAPEALDVITDAEKLVAVQPDPAPQPEAVASARLVSSWLYNRRPVEIPVRTVRKPTRLTAFIGTKADVKQGQVQVTTTLHYIIEYAGIDTFRFSVPEALADKVQISSKAGGAAPPIKQKSRATAAVDGWVTWTVVMQRDVLGSQPFEITYDLAPTAEADGKTEKSAIEAIQVLNPYDKAEGPQGKRDITVSRTIGEMTVIKDRALSVSAAATGGDAEPIDVRELQQLSQDGFVAFRYFKQPVKLDLTSNKFDVQGVIETVVSKALVEIVLDRAGTATFRARYAIKSSERQRLRVDLPSGVEPLGVLVDRKPVSLEKAGIETTKGWDSYFVNVARTKSSDEPFSLAVLFRNPLSPAPFTSNGGRLLMRLPVIGGSQNTGVAVQQLRTAVWVPDEYALVGTPKNFSVETRTVLRELLFSRSRNAFGTQDLDGWIGSDSGGVFDFPIEGRRYQYSNLGGRDTIDLGWWHLPFYTWIVSGAIVLIAIVLRGTSWENKLTLLIAAAFAAAAYALKDVDLIIHGLAVASYGLGALIAIWLVHCLLTEQKRSAATVPLVTPAPPPVAPTPSAASANVESARTMEIDDDKPKQD